MTRPAQPAAESSLSQYLARLAEPSTSEHPAPAGLWGFGGLHGGLVLAALTAAALRRSPELFLRSTTARFHRPVKAPFTLTTQALKEHGSTRVWTSTAAERNVLLADATVLASAAQSHRAAPRGPQAPRVDPPDRCPIFPVPVDFVPLSSQVEIRLCGHTTPYGGHDQPELIAWVRLTVDDEGPDVLRTLVLLDVLAPSYSSVLRDLAPMPTVEMCVHPSNGGSVPGSPWVLLRARTDQVSPDGWLSEIFDAWNEHGDHLASARQLRIIRAGAASPRTRW